MSSDSLKDDEKLSQRIRRLSPVQAKFTEKRMFRGYGFFVKGNMCLTTGDTRLLCRVDPKMQDDLMQTKACQPMTMKGKVIRGYLFVDETELQSDKELLFWIEQAVAYTASLPASKK